MSSKPEEEFDPEECETYDTVEHMFADFERKDREWEEKNPIRATIRKWMDKTFPNGIAKMRAYYAVQKPWEIFSYMKYEIIHAYQRMKRGYDDTASWHVGYYLARTLPPIIRQLKEKGHGLPFYAFEGLEPDKNYSYTDEQWKIAEERWNKVLDDIADGFESYIKFDEKVVRPEDYDKDEDYQKFQKALDLLKKHYQSLWD